MHLAKNNVPLFLRNKRARKLVQRQRRQEKLQRVRAEALLKIGEAFGRRSEIVKLLAAACPEEGKTAFRKLGYRLPAEFSVMDAPERAISSLAALAWAMLHDGLSSVFIDF